jgi:hypothetical protein
MGDLPRWKMPTQMENDFFVTDDLSVLKFENDFKRGLNIWRHVPFIYIYIYIYIYRERERERETP